LIRLMADLAIGTTVAFWRDLSLMAGPWSPPRSSYTARRRLQRRGWLPLSQS
jgi:hypothetical protein